MAEAMQAFKSTLVKTMSGTEAADLTVGGLTSIGALSIAGDEIDVTNFDSAGYKEYIPGFKDAGEVFIEGIVTDEDAFSKMLALADGDAIDTWTITFKSGATLAFSAWVKTFGTGSGGMSGAVTFSGSLRVSGKPVFTAATS